jgi:hypothetical protein
VRQRNVHELTNEIEQRRLDGGDRVDRRAQVERLQPAPPGVTVGESVADLIEYSLVLTEWSSDDQAGGFFQCRADRLAAGHFTEAGVSRTVLEE